MRKLPWRIYWTLAVILLLMNLPIVSAVEISSVQATDLTEESAVITWDTDVLSDSFVHYGTSVDNLGTKGSAAEVQQHRIALPGLKPSTNYSFSVESNSVLDNNGGAMYSFTTPAPDITAPALVVVLPALVAGAITDITGVTEPGAQVRLLVNGAMLRSFSVTDENGTFVFPQVTLSENVNNTITVEAMDVKGNKATFIGSVFADTQKPELKLEQVPSLVTDTSLTLKGTISEESKFEIVVNNRSVAKGNGMTIEKTISLEEGINHITITVVDAAGWTTVQELEVQIDTQAPTVKADIEKGTEYFENNAESSISGESEPGAKLFLYIYRPLGYEYKPDFQDARATTVADSKGAFSFKDVEFSQGLSSLTLEKLAPREVPSGLLQTTIFPIQEVAEQQDFSYYIYIVSEDKSGKTGYWQSQVTVRTCFSSNFDFGVESIPKFQAPLRLVPNLVDEGRQEIQAVFQFTYQGQATAGFNAQDQPQYRIQSVRIEKACTQGMQKDDKFGLGCKILPQTYRDIRNGDGSSLYVTWNLLPAKDFTERKDDFWNDFKKRQVMMPLKVTINYQERQGDQTYGQQKVQTSCLNLGYLVDIPIESKDYLPDFLANEGISSLNFTVAKLEQIEPVIKQAYLYAGAGCIISFMLRTGTRWVRIFTSKLEAYFSTVKAALSTDESKKQLKCDLNQNGLYLDETLKNWKDLRLNNPSFKVSDLPEDVQKALTAPEGETSAAWKQVSLNARCPKTAAAWKAEAALDTAYKWTCDRALCRTVPARWTASKSTEEIDDKIIKQQRCAVSGKGVALMERENCKELIKANPLALDTATKIDDVTACWQTADGTLYYNKIPSSESSDPKVIREIKDRDVGIYRLNRVLGVSERLGSVPTRLIVYHPDGSEGYMVGKDKTCKDICSNPRLKNVVSGRCVAEKNSAGGTTVLEELKDGEYAAGYTRDCFIKRVKPTDTKPVIDETKPATETKPIVIKNSPNLSPEDADLDYSTDGKPQFEQCVCSSKVPEATQYPNVHTAVAEKDGAKEDWSYQQERVFQESGKSSGTYYPSIRYYTGRDFSGAFGADYLLDYLNGEGKKEVPQINPHSQLIGTLQSVCLSGMFKNVRMLRNMLTGMRNCLIEAKYTGLQDAGMCKTLFTQQVCGLLYQGIAYMAGGCSGYSIDDKSKEGPLGDVGVIVSGGFQALEQSLQSSVTDISEDYGNAKLNEYFKGGAEGFAQAMCMAAFGLEFPLLSDDFLLDAAYAFPMKTNVVMAPTQRELSTYNPARQTALFTYKIGGVIMPGCRIRQWKVSLKCIGPEDLGFKGVDPSCGGKGCDCINAQSVSSPLEGEKTKLLKTNFNLPPTEVFSLPLDSSIKVDSHYRYDHVVVELELDPSEKGNENECFDEGYLNGNKGIYYVPLKDVLLPTELSCHADLVTGRYVCPELSQLFGFGGTYLEEPYVLCKDKKTETWVDCKTPNLFLLNDPIKVRVHLNSDGKAKCLKRTISPFGMPGVSDLPPRPLMQNAPGPMFPEENLGTVLEGMFGGVSASIAKSLNSNPQCGPPTVVTSPADLQAVPGTYLFTYTASPQNDGTVLLQVPAGVSILPTGGYSAPPGGYLIKTESAGTKTSFTIAEINRVNFNVGGYVINNVLGTVNSADSVKTCGYQVNGAGAVSASAVPNSRQFTVTYELLEADEVGGCLNAHQIAKASATSRTSYAQTITVQRQETAFQQTGGLHQAFMAGNYEGVQITTLQIMQQKRSDINNALAIYYDIASKIMDGRGTDAHKDQIVNLLGLFFERKFGAEVLPQYSCDVQSSADFQKMKMYLTEVAGKVGYIVLPGACS